LVNVTGPLQPTTPLTDYKTQRKAQQHARAQAIQTAAPAAQLGLPLLAAPAADLPQPQQHILAGVLTGGKRQT
jgi:hypothetical protein